MKNIAIISALLITTQCPANASVLGGIGKVLKKTVAAPFYLMGFVYGFTTGNFVSGIYYGVNEVEQ